MDKQTVDIPTEDGVADAYLVRPDGTGPWPGVLLFQDGFGLRPRLFEMADRIAEHGYVVLAPNLFYRAGRAPVVDVTGLLDPERRGAIFGQVMPLIQQLTPELITRDARAYLDFLDAQPGVARGPEGIVGYCMGALNALRAMEAFPERIAALESELDAAGVSYTSELYKGAPHGFTMADTASYNEEGEKRHWDELFALFDRTLAAR